MPTSATTDTEPEAPRTWRQWFRRLSTASKVIIGILLGVNVAALLAFAIFGKARINQFFNDLGASLRNMGPAGMLIVSVMVVLASHPPLLGYSASMTLIGYAWGIWPGFLIGVVAAEIGGLIAWFSVRTFFLGWMRTEGSKKNKHWEAFGHVIRERGVLLVIMIRWCPIPYGFGNGLLAAVEGIKFWQYFVANITFIPRLMVPVFIGSRFRSLGDKVPDPTRFWVNLASIAIALAFAIVTGVIVYRRTLVHMHRLNIESGGTQHEGEGDMAAEILEGAVRGYGAVEDNHEHAGRGGEPQS